MNARGTLIAVAIVLNGLVVVVSGAAIVVSVLVAASREEDAWVLPGLVLPGVTWFALALAGGCTIASLHRASTAWGPRRHSAIRRGLVSCSFVLVIGFAMGPQGGGLFSLVVLVPAVFVTIAALERQRLEGVDERLCKACGYDLRGVPTSVCPECGDNAT
jgi:hypothetical protein